MSLRPIEWAGAFSLAVAAHLALAAGFLGPEGAKIERGPGDGGPLVIGSLADAASEAADMEESRPEDAAEPETPEVPEAQPEPAAQDIEAVKPVAEAAPGAPMPALEESPPDEADSKPVQDAVLPPLPEDLKPRPPEALREPAPELTEKPAEPAEAEPVKPEELKLAEAEPVKPSPKPKQTTTAKPKPRKVRKGAVDSRRGGSGRAGRSGGGGRGLGGQALQSNYQGRVIAHLRRYKFYPSAAKKRRLNGTVRVKFTINAAGRVISSGLVSGSGSAVLDAGARQTIRRANPFPPFPRGLGKRRMTFVIPIRFAVR